MKILFSVVALAILVGLIIFNYHHIQHTANVTRLIGEIGQVLNMQGRQRFNVQFAFTQAGTGNPGSSEWLDKLQSNRVFFADPAAAIYRNQALLASWPFKSQLQETRSAIDQINAQFLMFDFATLDELESYRVAAEWKAQFIALTDKKQELDGSFARYLSGDIDRYIQRMLYINLFGVTSFLLACFTVFFLHQRQYVRQTRIAERVLRERQEELQYSRNVFRSLAEDLSRDRETLQRALDKLRHSNEQLERFAFVCSHDLQEPVRMVVSFSELLEKKIASQLDGKALQYLHFVTDGASRARDMIKDILTFCRLDQNTEAHSSVDLAVICQQVHNTLQPTMQERQATFSWSDKLPSLEGVPSQLFQLLLNLVGNGIKFNHSDVPEVRITASAVDTCWEIVVTDNGIGIDQRYIDQLFHIFTRLNAKTEFPGSGIGLAICKKIVEQHGGRIRIESEPGVGSRFIVDWPRTISNCANETEQSFGNTAICRA